VEIESSPAGSAVCSSPVYEQSLYPCALDLRDRPETGRPSGPSASAVRPRVAAVSRPDREACCRTLELWNRNLDVEPRNRFLDVPCYSHPSYIWQRRPREFILEQSELKVWLAASRRPRSRSAACACPRWQPDWRVRGATCRAWRRTTFGRSRRRAPGGSLAHIGGILCQCYLPWLPHAADGRRAQTAGRRGHRKARLFVGVVPAAVLPLGTIRSPNTPIPVSGDPPGSFRCTVQNNRIQSPDPFFVQRGWA